MAVSQDAVWQADENIGYVSNPSQDGLWLSDQNIGYVSNPSQDSVWQSDENITIARPSSSAVRIIRRRDV